MSEIIGKGMERLDLGGYEIALYSDQDYSACYTFKVERHTIPRGQIIPTTVFRWEEKRFLEAFGQALIELGIMKDHGTDQELKATKYHLEDFRKIVFRETK